MLLYYQNICIESIGSGGQLEVTIVTAFLITVTNFMNSFAGVTKLVTSYLLDSVRVSSFTAKRRDISLTCH